MLLHFIALGLILLAALPAWMIVKNLPLFQRLPRPPARSTEESKPGEEWKPATVSVLIPARDEAQCIGECLRHVLFHSGQDIEVLVLNDGSTDSTGTICHAIALHDSRVSVLDGGELPKGWNGKQYACWRLAQAAKGEWLLFIDADVWLEPDSIERLVAAARLGGIDLLSGFPFQVTITWSEKLLIPLMHFILLGYLPLARMRSTFGPEFAAGCGQLFLARKSAYVLCGGHQAIAASRHDGIKLPRAFRAHSLKTDIFDATDIAQCRMYQNAAEVFRGLSKNATEGIGNPRTILPFSILLGGAGVLPLIMLNLAIFLNWDSILIGELSIATALSFFPRLVNAIHFGQSFLGVVLHPISVLLFLWIQWFALIAQWFGYKPRWRGRI